MELKSSYTYIALFTPESDGGYSVRFPDLEGCFTCGESFDDARRMAVEAMSLYLYSLEQDEQNIPEPSKTVSAECSEMVVPITVWMAPFRNEMENRSIKKTLSIPAWLNDAAERAGVNYSQLLQSALKEYLGLYQR